MLSDFEARIRAVDWSGYRTAYGPLSAESKGTGDGSEFASRRDALVVRLVLLASPDRALATSAAQELWADLCHQFARVSSASLPVLPFVLEILDSADGDLAVELLDILRGVANCLVEGWLDPPGVWANDLRSRLNAELPRFRALSEHGDDLIAALARDVVEVLRR